MQKKLEYTIIGSTLGMINALLIDTRYTVIGLMLGIIGAGYLIKALRIKQ